MKFAKFLALFCAVGAFAACTPAGPEQPAAKGSIKLSADKTTLELGESVTFTAVMEDEETCVAKSFPQFHEMFDSAVMVGCN